MSYAGPVFAALVPIFATFLLGAILRRSAFLGQTVWDGLDRLVFYILFPSLLFIKTAHADLQGEAVGQMVGVLCLAVVGTAALTRLTKPLSGLDDRAFVSVYQAGFRMNAYVGIAASTALLPGVGAGLAAIAIAIVAPLINGLSVVALTTLNAAEERASKTNKVRAILPLFRGFLVNPLIVATLGGIALNLAGIPVPGIPADILTLLSAGALPLALLGVGAGLALGGFAAQVGALAIACFFKLMVAPVLVILLCFLFGLTGPAVCDITTDRNREARQTALASTNGKRVQQGLCRVFMTTVARINNRAINLLGQ